MLLTSTFAATNSSSSAVIEAVAFSSKENKENKENSENAAKRFGVSFKTLFEVQNLVRLFLVTKQESWFESPGVH